MERHFLQKIVVFIRILVYNELKQMAEYISEHTYNESIIFGDPEKTAN